MATRLNPQISRCDTARQAMEFYESVFEGELTVSTFADFQASDDPAEQDKVMHSALAAENGLLLMVADTPNRMAYTTGTSYAVSLSGGADDAELRGYWHRLSDGATIGEPLKTAPWGDAFGMCTDKFGVTWMVNIAAAQRRTEPESQACAEDPWRPGTTALGSQGCRGIGQVWV